MKARRRRGGRPQGTGSQAERVLRLSVALRSQPWSLEELAAQHGVTERTVRRDLDVLGRVMPLTRVTNSSGTTFALEGA